MAKDLRGAPNPYLGPIVIILERKHDAWLARWSGADAWLVRPVDPFELADRLVDLIQGHRARPVERPVEQPAEQARKRPREQPREQPKEQPKEQKEIA